VRQMGLDMTLTSQNQKAVGRMAMLICRFDGGRGNIQWLPEKASPLQKTSSMNGIQPLSIERNYP